MLTSGWNSILIPQDGGRDSILPSETAPIQRYSCLFPVQDPNALLLPGTHGNFAPPAECRSNETGGCLTPRFIRCLNSDPLCAHRFFGSAASVIAATQQDQYQQYGTAVATATEQYNERQNVVVTTAALSIQRPHKLPSHNCICHGLWSSYNTCQIRFG